MRDFNVLYLSNIDQTEVLAQHWSSKIRIQTFCSLLQFLGLIELRQGKTALNSVKLGPITSPTVKTLKSKAVLSAQKVGKTKNESCDKKPKIGFDFQDFYREWALMVCLHSFEGSLSLSDSKFLKTRGSNRFFLSGHIEIKYNFGQLISVMTRHITTRKAHIR